MVIFDEFNSANELNLLDKDYAYKLICEYKDKTEIILTGRNPEEKYVEISTRKAFTFRSNYRQDEYVK